MTKKKYIITERELMVAERNLLSFRELRAEWAATIRSRPATAPATCTWKENEEYGMYETGCGNAFQTIEGDIEENNFKFCPYCGGKIRGAQR